MWKRRSDPQGKPTSQPPVAPDPTAPGEPAPGPTTLDPAAPGESTSRLAPDEPAPGLPDPLSDEEERLWRSLQKLLVALPRALDDDLLRDSGMSLTPYLVLMHLSEAPGGRLRMTDLAAATALSASRITRVVETLRALGFVVKQPYPGDARGSVAVITAAGAARLRDAYPAHLNSVRCRVMDRLDPDVVGPLAARMQSVADGLCAGPRESGERAGG